MLDHKASLGKFKKTEIVSSIFSGHNIMRLEINYYERTAKFNTWRLNNMILNDQRLTQEIKEEIKKVPRDKRKEIDIFFNLFKPILFSFKKLYII